MMYPCYKEYQRLVLKTNEQTKLCFQKWFQSEKDVLASYIIFKSKR